MLGESLKSSLTNRTWHTPWVFGAGFASGIVFAVAIAGLRPTLTTMWQQTPPLDRTADGTTAPATDEPERLAARQLTQGMGDLAPYFTVMQAARLSRERLEMEAAADSNLKRSKELAVQSISVRDAGREDDEETLAELQHQEYLWEAAIRQIDQIPEASILAETAAQKREEYMAILEPVKADIDELQSAFLAEIAEDTGRPHAIRITICHLSGECRDYKGDQPPASPASLIKLPIAVVLMQKVTEEGTDLSEEMHIDRHNWTENARGAKIFVDEEYPIREVMVRMIKESNNIATNQLIDYLGWEYMDDTLEELGYETTKIRSKLTGNRVRPTRNRSVGRNVVTTNELTEMMRQIYTFTNSGDEEILEGMVGQYDWDFGYIAVKRLRDKRVAWIGEKTGQNSNVIGSSVAVKIDNERYVVTATIDNSGNKWMLRDVIGETIQHILDDGHLVPVER